RLANMAAGVPLGLSQAEECFCDFIALRLFGESYLHALAYLLAPMHSGQRPLEYPNTTTRINHLKSAATKFAVEVPSYYDGLFEDLAAPNDVRQKYLVKLADHAASTLIT